MQAASTFQSFCLRYLTRPRHHQSLFRHVAKQKPRRLVQVGLDGGRLAQQLLSLVLRNKPQDKVRFVGIDPFESGQGDGPRLSLKEAHKLFRHDAIDVRLVPGDASTAFPRLANELRGTDLIVVQGPAAVKSLQNVWHLVSRMLHKDSTIWLEEVTQSGKLSFCVLGPSDIRVLGPSRKAAA